MKKTTLCYIENNDSYLMLLRNKKKNDENSGKWIGVGGKFEEGETPEECLIREVMEETGLELTSYRFRGIVTFISDIYDDEEMYLYTADGYLGELTECNEGELSWIKKNEVSGLKLWEGDRKFLELLLDNSPEFRMTLTYSGDSLISSNYEFVR